MSRSTPSSSTCAARTAGRHRQLAEMKPQAGGGVEIEIDVVHRVEAPQQRRVDDSCGARDRACSRAAGIRARRASARGIGSSRSSPSRPRSASACTGATIGNSLAAVVAPASSADRQVPPDALRPRLLRPPQRPPPLGDEQARQAPRRTITQAQPSRFTPSPRALSPRSPARSTASAPSTARRTPGASRRCPSAS